MSTAVDAFRFSLLPAKFQVKSKCRLADWPSLESSRSSMGTVLMVLISECA